MQYKTLINNNNKNYVSSVLTFLSNKLVHFIIFCSLKHKILGIKIRIIAYSNTGRLIINQVIIYRKNSESN